MKKTLSLATAGLFLLLTGCASTQPAFDPAKTAAQTINGKTYNIPVDAVTTEQTDKQIIAFYKKLGLECKDGDIVWQAQNAQEAISNAIATGDKEIHKKLAEENRIGCASPVK